MEIRTLDQQSITADEADQLAELKTRCDPNRLRTDPPVSPQLAINGLRPSVATFAFDYYAMFDEGRLVAFAETFGAVDAENTDIAEVGIFTDQALADPGLHRIMFDHIEAIERGRGRERFWGWGNLADTPTRDFWEGELGYTLAYDERISRCVVADVDPDLMAAWIERAAERAGAYELFRAEAPFDDGQLELFAEALEAMNDAPDDDLEYEDETFDVERARQIQTLHLSTQSSYRAVFAVERASGELAGYTALRIPDAEPAYAKQGDTVTIDKHRNQGIGRWIKADMWQWLRADRPEVTFLDTGNAESNRAMLAINEAMGFGDILHHGVWQLTPG